MHISTKVLTKVLVVAIAANVLQCVGIALPSAAAATASESSATQKSGDGAIDLQQELFGNRTALPQQTHETSISLNQYSDNPTIPGDGTPQRSQGSGTR